MVYNVLGDHIPIDFNWDRTCYFLQLTFDVFFSKIETLRLFQNLFSNIYVH